MLISIDQLVARSNLLAKVLSHRKWAPWMAPVPFAQTSEELACDQRLHIAVLVHVQGIVDQGLMIKKCSNIITYIYIYIYVYYSRITVLRAVHLFLQGCCQVYIKWWGYCVSSWQDTSETTRLI